MLILKAVSLKPLHGYGVLLRIQQISGDALEIPQGSLYPALYRLEHQDLIVAEWRQSENNRRAKYYTVTAAGRRRLREETAGWNRLGSAVAAALETTSEEGRKVEVLSLCASRAHRPSRFRSGYDRGTTLPYREIYRRPGAIRGVTGRSGAP